MKKNEIAYWSELHIFCDHKHDLKCYKKHIENEKKFREHLERILDLEDGYKKKSTEENKNAFRDFWLDYNPKYYEKLEKNGSYRQEFCLFCDHKHDLKYYKKHIDAKRETYYAFRRGCEYFQAREKKIISISTY